LTLPFLGLSLLSPPTVESFMGKLLVRERERESEMKRVKVFM